MTKDIIIIGAGGHSKVIADIIEKSGDNLIGFLDDNLDVQNKIIYKDKKVIGTTSDIEKYNDLYFIIGIGNNSVRKKISEKYSLNWYTAIHPNAIVANCVTIGEGSVIMAGAVINTYTTIGRHCIINTNSSIDHDNVIGDYVHISPRAVLAGTVSVKDLTWICVGATIINNIFIEKNNIIGAGAVVIRDILESDSIYVGVPAMKMIK